MELFPSLWKELMDGPVFPILKEILKEGLKLLCFEFREIGQPPYHVCHLQ